MADDLPYEHVPLNLARQALEELPGAKPGERAWRSGQRAPRVKRRGSLPEDLQLTEATSNWLAQLPSDIRPHRLAQAFPRVTNELAERWSRPVGYEAYFKQLLFVDRPSRDGFPEAIALELNRLFEYFETVHPRRAHPERASPGRIDVWENVGRR